MLIDHFDDLFFGITLLPDSNSITYILLEISSKSWFYFWGEGQNVDATNLKGGRDYIFLTGKWEEYNKAFDASGNIILTREIEVLSQKVT